MNDLTLPSDRGFSIQLVAKGRYGYKWAKWITKIKVTDKDCWDTGNHEAIIILALVE